MEHSDRHDDQPLGPYEEAVLEYSLGRGPGALAAPDAPAEAEALRELVERTRSQLAASAPSLSEQRIGELRLAARRAARPAGFWDHLRGGLEHSLLIRVAAASLVIHLAALPVLAWIHLKATPERSLNIRFEQPPEALTSEPKAELLEPIDVDELPLELDTEAPSEPR